jgi:hypothetical protein
MHDSRSIDAARVVTQARTEAQRLGHAQVGTEHLLLGLLGDDRADAADLLHAAGCTLPAARHMVSEIVVADAVPAAVGASPDGGAISPRAERALNRAGRFARQERAGDVTSRHVLLGVLDVEGLACQVLRRLDVDLPGLRRAAGGVIVDDPTPVPTTTPTPTISAGTDGVDEDGARPAPPVRPTCAGCHAALDDTLAHAVLAAADTSGDMVPVQVAYCGACGRTVGTVGAGS